MTTQLAIGFAKGAWADVGGGMTDGLRYLLSNQTPFQFQLYEAAAAPSSVVEGHSVVGNGGQIFVTKESGATFWAICNVANGKVVVSERA